MCEIYGFSGSRERALNQDLQTFFSHACEHPNGWGLALLDSTAAEILREARRADRSNVLNNRLRCPVTAKNALAHIRYATIGNEEYVNCHPFTAVDRDGRRWTLIHNGTIFESDKLNQYIFRQQGETDSERVLLYIVDQINAASVASGSPLAAGERFAVLDRILRESSPKNKLNLLIFDGELMYAHTNYKNSLYARSERGCVTISTRPLTNSGWRQVELTTLVAFREGSRVFTGTNHHHEYFYDPSAYRPLYLAYSGL